MTNDHAAEETESAKTKHATEQSGEQPQVGATQDQGTSAADKHASEDKSANGAASDVRQDANRDKVFSLYQDALDSAEWGYKAKSGPERDIAHKSVILAERAYVSAALYDKPEADKMFEKATGRPPKQELQQRVKGVANIDPAKGIADLTAGLEGLQKKQELRSLTHNKNQIEKQMGNWEVALGDAHERKRDHQRKANEELLKPERPGQNDESGLEMMLRSLKNGYRAGKDWQLAISHERRRKEINGLMSDSRKEHGDLTKQIATFAPERGGTQAETTGPVGQNAQRFPGAAGIVAGALSDILRPAMGAEQETPEQGRDNKTPALNLKQRASVLVAMNQSQSQAQGLRL